MLEEVTISSHRTSDSSIETASRLHEDAYGHSRQDQASTNAVEQPSIQLAQYYQAPPMQQWILHQLELGGSRYPGYPPQAGRDSAEALCEARRMSSNECYDFKHLSPREQYDYDRLQSNQDRDDYLRDRR